MSYVQKVLETMRLKELSLASFPEAFEKAASSYIIKMVKEGEFDHAKLMIGEDLRVVGFSRHYGEGKITIDVDVLEDVINIYHGDSNEFDVTFSYENDTLGIMDATNHIIELLRELP